MNDWYKSWLEQNTTIPGILLGGISLGDHSCVGRSNHAAYPLERLPQILRHLAEFSEGLVARRLPATRLLWSFENALVHWATRPDNASLALLTSSDSTTSDLLLIERLVDEFLQLEPGT